ncbi:hypothetical protein I306_05920 [Cryptococcus gattii EJB2]|uniref:PWWP domain-containing protein n=1 Tax=Cryptococcus gattii EJB2 TaxID=1296103 RepID=A0ABR5BN69_9TREE|nr:hypothetical protein I306_05920 [Cryptococcus gattii EJB2]
MPKRKSNPSDHVPNPPLPLSSLDAALDLLVCDTFTRLNSVAAKFEACAGVKLNDGVVKARWEEAVSRYWVIKSMDELTCGAKKIDVKDGTAETDYDVLEQNGVGGNQVAGKTDNNGRPLPASYPGAVAIHCLSPEEEHEWRKWTPKVGDVVLVDTLEDGLWPAKIIDKKTFFQGRTVPRGSHFFPVRIYNEDMPPSITVKSRLIPLHLRPSPPLMASTALLSAYHHAANPTTFDMLATAREMLAAHNRLHPGVTDEESRAKFKAEKEAWNRQVNWVMGERRVEKLRSTAEEREKRLRAVARSTFTPVNEGQECPDPCEEEIGSFFDCPKKRRTVPRNENNVNASSDSCSTIFGPTAPTFPHTPPRTASPSVASLIRPSLSNTTRPSSPRRTPTRSDKRRVHSFISDLSPASRRTYTPPMILPSGDETAPPSFGSATLPSEMKDGKFDFVSPLGPVKKGKLSSNPEPLASSTSSSISKPQLGRSGSLEIVREEEEEDGWTVVQRRGRRAGSEPVKQTMEGEEKTIADDMEL